MWWLVIKLLALIGFCTTLAACGIIIGAVIGGINRGQNRTRGADILKAHTDQRVSTDAKGNGSISVQGSGLLL